MAELPAFVPDTNVLISRAIRRQSVVAQAFNLAMKLFVPLRSPATMQELEKTLAKSKFDRYVSNGERIAFIRAYKKATILIKNPPRITACRDPEDDMVLGLALAGNARLILTGDDDLLALHPFTGVDILTPRQFLARYTHSL